MAKTLAIMQPYFLPYMGYWQLINTVDEFILYDNIEYTKKGWINRNRFLLNGHDELFSLPLKADSDFLTIIEREISPTFEREKLIRQLQGAYQKAPYYSQHFPLFADIIQYPEQNLFAYISNSVQMLCQSLGIGTKFVISSDIQINHTILKAQDKVIALCQAQGATGYINPIGGVELYDKEAFKKQGMNLSFLRSLPLDYHQFGKPAIPHLSILDVLMFNSLDQVRDYLESFGLE